MRAPALRISSRSSIPETLNISCINLWICLAVIVCVLKSLSQEEGNSMSLSWIQIIDYLHLNVIDNYLKLAHAMSYSSLCRRIAIEQVDCQAMHGCQCCWAVQWPHSWYTSPTLALTLTLTLALTLTPPPPSLQLPWSLSHTLSLSFTFSIILLPCCLAASTALSAVPLLMLLFWANLPNPIILL